MEENDPRIVTPEEAAGLEKAMTPLPPIFGDLVYTVATEPDRIRATVVKALRGLGYDDPFINRQIRKRADEIEKGRGW